MKLFLRVTSALTAIGLLALLLVFAIAHPGGAKAATISRPASFHPLSHHRAQPAGAFSYNCTSYGASSGNQVMNITEKVSNDADSGIADYWALDVYTRTIKVWNIGPDEYCAIETYKTGVGQGFVAVAGQASPGAIFNPDGSFQTGGYLTGDEYGTISGSLQDVFTAQLDVSDPSIWPLNGKVNGGTAMNYGCTSFVPGSYGNYGSVSCPTEPAQAGPCGSTWMGNYFTNFASCTQPEWGFKYVGKDSQDKSSTGVWIDSSAGISGDILDVD